MSKKQRNNKKRSMAGKNGGAIRKNWDTAWGNISTQQEGDDGKRTRMGLKARRMGG